MAPRAKPTTPVDPVEAAAKRATIPTRPVIEHTKLFRAELLLAQSAANSELEQADHIIVTAVEEKNAAQNAAAIAEQIAIEAANTARRGADALATQRFNTIRSEIEKERNDIICKLDSIEAALKSIADAEPKAETRSEPDNVVQIAAE